MAAKQAPPSLLAQRLATLGNISAAELSAMIRVPLERCVELFDGAPILPDERVRLRLIFDPAQTYAAEFAAETVRARETPPWSPPAPPVPAPLTMHITDEVPHV